MRDLRDKLDLQDWICFSVLLDNLAPRITDECDVRICFDVTTLPECRTCPYGAQELDGEEAPNRRRPLRHPMRLLPGSIAENVQILACS